MRLDQLLPGLLASDPGRPRITCYDDTTGERIELSGKVLANWVAKAANLLQEEYDAGPGTVVRLDLPAHWRTAYWALACWAVGACIDQSRTAPDVLVTTDPAADGAIVVTLAALARSAALPVPAGSIDEARELATYPDRFDAWARAADTDPALVADLPRGGPTLTYADGPSSQVPTSARVHTVAGSPTDFLRLMAATYAADGSLVVSRGTDPGDLSARVASEGVTYTC